ncbi:MAG: hypothetical protein GF401_03280 [Chitinivibrionales bacterium]|nr:hypothetical protein [Chitinivibrionales bacterium]
MPKTVHKPLCLYENIEYRPELETLIPARNHTVLPAITTRLAQEPGNEVNSKVEIRKADADCSISQLVIFLVVSNPSLKS